MYMVDSPKWKCFCFGTNVSP